MNKDSIRLHQFIKKTFPTILANIEPPSKLSTSFISKMYHLILKARNAYSVNSKNIRESEMTLLEAGDSHPIDTNMPPDIASHIRKTKKYYKTFSFAYGTKTCMVHFYHPVSIESKTKIAHFFKIAIYKIYLWLYVADSFASKSCSKTLNLYFYFTDLKKSIPNVKTTAFKEFNVNTGYTFSCKPINDINIYRKEEWFKVFIHETFHNLGFDFCDMDCTEVDARLRSLFSVDLQFNLFETYSEMWAETMNFLFLAFFSTESHDAALIQFGEIMRYEVAYSLFQCAKVLRHHKLSYSRVIDVTKPLTKYSEDTYVFSYYVIKSMLLFYWNDFIEWCSSHNKNLLQFNKTKKNLASFVDFIDELHNGTRFLENIGEVENKSGVAQNGGGETDFVHKTMRMTLHEF